MAHRELLSAVHRDDPSLAFKVGGLDALAAMEKIKAHDEPTQGSGSSGYSDLSALENETDELGRRILQHERDQRRLRNVMDSNLHVLGKPRPHPRNTGHFGRREEDVAAGLEHDRVGTSGSNDSEPPLNVPRIWGRKGRRQDDWLRRSSVPVTLESSHSPTKDESRAQEEDADSIIPHRTMYTGDEDWTDLANEPLRSAETTPPSMRRHNQITPPSSMRHMNTTLGDAVDSEDHDFSSASLFASTPAVNRRDRKIDELTRRELETVESQRITKRSLQDLFKPVNAKPSEERPSSAPSSDIRQQTRRRRSLINNKENVAPNSDANGSYKGTETVGIVSRNAQAVTFKNAQRPAHRRNDSIDLLRKLSRVSSMSPVAAKDKTVRNVLEGTPRSQPEADVEPLSAKSTDSDYICGKLPHDDEPDEQRPTAATAADADMRNATADAENEDQEDNDLPRVDVTPAPKEPQSHMKTPTVTGAWVDTPGPGLDVRPLLHTSDSTIVRAFGSPSGTAALEPRSDILEADMRRIVSEPPHAKSALADILREAKADAQLGDTTIQSLENIMNAEVDQTDPSLTLDVDEAIGEVSTTSEDLTQAEKDRRQEDLAMEAMNKHLRAARTSLEDANRGMRRVEHKIETTVQQHDPLPVAEAVSITAPSRNPEVHNLIDRTTVVIRNGKTVCSACGGTYHSSVWYALWSEFRSCFYTYDPKASFPPGVRFTWLGLMCIWWLAWFLVENTLCSYYCHPEYVTYTREPWGVDPNAPRYPFVIPTLTFRPVEWLWRPAVEYVEWALGVLGNAVFGDQAASPDPRVVRPAYSSGVVREALMHTVSDGGWVSTATQASVRVTQSVVQALDDVGSMWDDEWVP